MRFFNSHLDNHSKSTVSCSLLRDNLWSDQEYIRDHFHHTVVYTQTICYSKKGPLKCPLKHQTGWSMSGRICLCHGWEWLLGGQAVEVLCYYT